MMIETYLSSLSEEERQLINTFRKIISENDPLVSEAFGKFMSSENAFCYNEQGVFKYGIVLTKKHLSFHSLVMYMHPELMTALKAELPRAKFQKGCVNFNQANDFPAPVLAAHIQASAKIDFSPVIERYHKKK